MEDTSWTLITVPQELDKERLDVILFRLLEEIPSRNVASKLIEHGFVRTSKPPKASLKMKGGDTFSLCLDAFSSPQKALQGEPMELHILYEDEHLLVLNKAPGIVVHPGAGHFTGTLVHGLLHHCGSLPSLKEEERAGVVHRLDKDTSGVMVFAKTIPALSFLSQAFSRHEQHRLYQALVWNIPSPLSGSLESWHGRDEKNRIKFACVEKEKGKYAKLDYQTIGTFHNIASLVECTLYTGRTHQIRVQMTSQGTPLLGDLLYGSIPPSFQKNKEFLKKLQNILHRQMLHASTLGFKHPFSQEYLEFCVPPPPDFCHVKDLMIASWGFSLTQ